WQGALLVLAVRLVSVAVDPPILDRSGSTFLRVKLSGPVPQDANIQLTTDHPELGLFPQWKQFPQMIQTIPAGDSELRGPITLRPVGVRTDVTVTASYGGVSVSTTIRLLPPTVARLRLDSTEISGGLPVQGTLELSGAAPAGDYAITLTSDNPAVGSVPAR